jgi:hypothetical protein
LGWTAHQLTNAKIGCHCTLQNRKYKHDYDDLNPVIGRWIREMNGFAVVKFPNVIVDHIFDDIQNDECQK